MEGRDLSTNGNGAQTGKKVIGVLLHPSAGLIATFEEAGGKIEFEDGQTRQIVAVMDFVDGKRDDPACYITFDSDSYASDPWLVIYKILKDDGTVGLALGQPQPTRNAAIEEAHKVFSVHFKSNEGEDTNGQDSD